VGVYSRAVRVQPGRKEVRRKLVELAMELERFGDARPHLAHLLESAPEDAWLELSLARCLEADREYSDAVELYENARKHDPARLESSVRLASLLRRQLNEVL